MSPPPYYQAEQVTLHLGDSLDVLPTLSDASVDAIVCDPPYEIGIADRNWDRTGIAYNVNLWTECLRALKPGGHLLAFGAPRTYHRMACAVEDAGFRIIDQLDWIYTHGKPKGTDLARSIDRRRDDRAQVLEVTAWLAAARDAAGWTNRQMDALWGFDGMAGHWTTQGKAAMTPTREQWDRLQAELSFDDTEIRPALSELWARKGTVGEAFARREIISETWEAARNTSLYKGYSGHRIKSRAASDEARQWEGWNTALKPAHDPILLARKGTGFDTLTANVLRHGVGGLNIAGCPAEGGGYTPNILLGHDCPPGGCLPSCPVREVGGAARSFPVFRLNSRTPDSERVEVDGVRHDTPKPLALMSWLVRLVCPPGGTVLDPVAGSGTTLLAARGEGMHAIGVELDEAHARICVQRLSEPYSESLFSAAVRSV
ncbi:DNA methyltransferase [Streptomyces sp. ActVer]|uniref:DNA-methyltransferase n=1 Tax=Streptomyces sp. ActVer TaxID=3014558 RepID=UPI0022B30C08|nr:DNA methyltransferase [Streptomyces sp. ActVer]MCZ4513507.1 DNA methyltransferase [Streptomyces sp. ActVer]